MADRILVQCPSCSAKLAISDESKLGKKIRCSKCSEVFVAKALKASDSKTSTPTKSAKPKPKKSDEDEFNFDDMEMEDKSPDEEEESEEESRPLKTKSGKSKKGAKGKGKKKSGGNMPLIIGGSVAVVLLMGVGGYFLFSGGGGGAPSPAPAIPGQPAAQQQATVPPAAITNTPTTGPAAGPSTAPVAAGVTPAGVTPPMSASELQRLLAEMEEKKAKALGETAAVLAVEGTELPAGTNRPSATTRWHWNPFERDKSGQQDVIELQIDVQGDVVRKVCAFGKADLATIVAASDETLSIFRSLSQPSGTLIFSDAITYYIPYEPTPESGMPFHPENVIRVMIPFIAPKTPATSLKLVEGTFKLRIAQMMEEIEIPDLRAAADKPLEHPSLKAAGTGLWLRTENSRLGGTVELLEFRIGANNAVGLLIGQPLPGLIPVFLAPDYEADANDHHFSTRKTTLAGLPKGPIALKFKLYSQIEEFVVPFRFENVPLPSLDKKPKPKPK